MLSAVILAAGKGCRAWPYAGLRQKVTLPVLNVPIIQRLVEDIKSLGIKEIVVVVGHRASAVRAVLAEIEGITFVEQRSITGTADAALLGLNSISGEKALLCYGDIVTTRAVIEKFVKAFQIDGQPAKILTTRSFPSSAITVNVEADVTGRVSRIYHCGSNSCGRCFAGIAAVRKDIFIPYLLRHPGIAENCEGAMPISEADISYSLDLLCQAGVDVGIIGSHEFVVDVDKPWQLVEANVLAGKQFFRETEKDFLLDDGASISEKAFIADGVKLILATNARIGDYCRINSSLMLGENARVDQGALIRADGPVIIGTQSLVNNYSYVGGRSVIGARCIVGHGAEFHGIAFDDVSIRHPAQVGAVLGSKVNIAGGVMTANWRFDDDTKEQFVGKHREKPDQYGELTFLGDYVRVGNNVSFSPGTKVGTYSCIGPGIWVAEDIPDRSLVLQKQEIIRKDWGPERYGW